MTGIAPPGNAEFNAQVIEEFRANGGRVGGAYEGSPLVLLHTTGAKSGSERVNPMMALELDGRLFVFASKGGQPKHPDWYHNLVAHPTVTVEFGTETFLANAAVLERPERDRVYAEQARRYPRFGEYETRTTRLIPVVALDRS